MTAISESEAWPPPTAASRWHDTSEDNSPHGSSMRISDMQPSIHLVCRGPAWASRDPNTAGLITGLVEVAHFVH